MTVSLKFQPHYRDMIQALLDENVAFMLVGAYALTAYGLPRFTQDIDFFVLADATNAPLIIKALARFGAPLDNITTADFEKTGMVFQIGVAPCRIDIITEISGVDFRDAYPRALKVEIDGLTVPVLSFVDLIANKRASGRPKDLLDVELLEKHRAAGRLP